ncbi:hypothetical protein DPMN_119850 [Dreissena polymorpha]|uniref:Uncharacterized protein n=1 Tax=Dreissena polymorpha TaxID=45954 RepID=A0A9D4GMN2_DREPO|nr:hypothetical protein DPMN_119850 [Dreissena polymorpha]
MARQRPTRIPTPHGPGLVMGTCIVEIDRIVIREIKNEEIIVKGYFGLVWSMWAGRPRIDCIVIREVQYQFEVNQCRNEEIIVKGNFEWAWPMWPGRPRIDRIVIREAQNEEVNFQGSSANSVGGAGGQDGRTDAHHHYIPTFSPKNVEEYYSLKDYAVV